MIGAFRRMRQQVAERAANTGKPAAAPAPVPAAPPANMPAVPVRGSEAAMPTTSPTAPARRK